MSAGSESSVPEMWEMRKRVRKRMVKRDLGIEAMVVNWEWRWSTEELA